MNTRETIARYIALGYVINFYVAGTQCLAVKYGPDGRIDNSVIIFFQTLDEKFSLRMEFTGE